MNSFSDLRYIISGIGHAEYPFLHPTYCPMSRIPCADFSEWIKQNLKSRNYPDIQALFYEIIKANPGVEIQLGTNSAPASSSLHRLWREKLEKIELLNLTNYITLEDKNAYLDLKTALILALPHNGRGAEMLFASVLSPYMVIGTNLAFTQLNPILAQEVCALPLISRAHLVDIMRLTRLKKKSTSMLYDHTTFYETRAFGLNIDESINLLLESGLVVYDKATGHLLNTLSKDAILSILCKNGLCPPCSWSKARLIGVLSDTFPQETHELCEGIRLVSLNPKYQCFFDDLFNNVSLAMPLFKDIMPYIS